MNKANKHLSPQATEHKKKMTMTYVLYWDRYNNLVVFNLLIGLFFSDNRIFNDNIYIYKLTIKAYPDSLPQQQQKTRQCKTKHNNKIKNKTKDTIIMNSIIEGQ